MDHKTPQPAPADLATHEVDIRRPEARPRPLLVNFLIATSLIGFLILLRQRTQIPPPQAPQPLAFDVLMQRFGDIALFSDRMDVEKLLGPPTHFGDLPDYQEWEERALHSNRGCIPAMRCWHRWTDASDPNRWIAVLYGGVERHTVYWIGKKGF